MGFASEILASLAIYSLFYRCDECSGVSGEQWVEGGISRSLIGRVPLAENKVTPPPGKAGLKLERPWSRLQRNRPPAPDPQSSRSNTANAPVQQLLSAQHPYFFLANLRLWHLCIIVSFCKISPPDILCRICSDRWRSQLCFVVENAVTFSFFTSLCAGLDRQTHFINSVQTFINGTWICDIIVFAMLSCRTS